MLKRGCVVAKAAETQARKSGALHGGLKGFAHGPLKCTTVCSGRQGAWSYRKYATCFVMGARNGPDAQGGTGGSSNDGHSGTAWHQVECGRFTARITSRQAA